MLSRERELSHHVVVVLFHRKYCSNGGESGDHLLQEGHILLFALQGCGTTRLDSLLAQMQQGLEQCAASTLAQLAWLERHCLVNAALKARIVTLCHGG